MAITTVADVLQRAAEFEKMLAEYYDGLSRSSTREGVRMLANYMSRHRVRMEENLKNLSPAQLARVRGEPLRYDPQAADCRCFEGVTLSPEASASQVLDAAITFDECLVRLYRQVLQQPVAQEVKELFESLTRAEERDEIELKKIKAMDYF